MRRPEPRRTSQAKSHPRLKGLLVAIGFLTALQASGQSTIANPIDGARRRADAAYQISARADYTGERDRVTRRDAFVATTHLRFASPARPVAAGLMVEYRLSDGQADRLLIGGMFSYRLPGWTIATSPFYNQTMHGTGVWQYWCRGRRHITDRHAIDVELFGSLETGRPGKWMLGYFRSVTESLSVNVAAGSRFDAGSDWLARTSVTWRPRPNHR